MSGGNTSRVVAFPGPSKGPHQAGHNHGTLFAALDLGTNSCRMLIARPSGAEFQVVDAFSKPVHLGTGLEQHGTLSRAAINRTISALHVCGRKLRQHGVTHRRLVATEACRRAKNGRSFIKQVKAETGLKLEIIKPHEEARLAVISCAPHVAAETEQLLVIDIGGGSTELVWTDLSRISPPERARAIMRLQLDPKAALRGGDFPRAEVVDWISVPLGVATLKDQFMDVEDDTGRFALMSWYFEEHIAEFGPYTDEGQADLMHGFQIVGTSGTVTTVAASHLGLAKYDRNKVDGLSLTAAQINTVIESYLAMGPLGRLRDARIGRDRHQLIMSGAAILQTILRIWPTDRLSVADRGLREGLLFSQMSAAGVLSPNSG
jgi:exopolyphosphatase / guanosine-5'-triphosphate,3'-diphosphate pyrophosphatase